MPHAAGLWYEWTGNPEGETLLLSSGLGGSAGYWAPNLAALGARYRILSYDHRGTGRSEAELPEHLTVEDMATDVCGLLDALDLGKVHFIGHALGGLIGMEVALTHTGRIEKLVVVNGWSSLDPHTERCFDVRLELLRNSGPGAYIRAQPIFLYPAGWISEHHCDLEEEAVHQLAAFPLIGNVEKRIAAVRRYGIELLDLLDANPLFLASEDDMLVPAGRSIEMAEKCYWSKLKMMTWGGHACNVTDPDNFNHLVLDFLRS